MTRRKRPAILLTVFGVVCSLLIGASTGVAHASESIPELQWPAVATASTVMTSSPNGDLTQGCYVARKPNHQDVTTYDANGNVVRKIASPSDYYNYPICMQGVITDKNGNIYGGTYDSTVLRAYTGNTPKWEYDTGCTAGGADIGPNGNLYFVNGDGRLTGITPDVAPGTSQPKKILDVPITPYWPCTEVKPLKSVIVVIIGGSEFYYYDYSGKSLGSPPGDYWQSGLSELNADGRLFYSPANDSHVSAYDPLTKKVAWTVQVATPGAEVQEGYGAGAVPLPGGGILASIREQKMVSDNVPAEPKEFVEKLEAYNSAGQKIWGGQLPNSNGNNKMVGLDTRADVTGKIVMIRHWRLQVNGENNVPFVSIDVLSAATGQILGPPKFLRGNIDPDSGPLTGYHIPVYVALGPYTLYVQAIACSSTDCYAGSNKLYPIKIDGLGLDYPRGAIIGVSTARPYVAMGDSYSSGQGAKNYDVGTTTSTNACYKSADAYGRVLARNPANKLSLTAFVACGGAVTSDIHTTTTYPGVEKPQDVALSSVTKVVTITMGGNDIGFSSVVYDCANPVKVCEGAISGADNRLGVLHGQLGNAYQDILREAPEANVYVVGYPPLFAAGPGCSFGEGTPFFTEERKLMAIGLLNRLNAKIKDTVDMVRGFDPKNQRLQYIDPLASNSPFIGHDICSDDPFFHGVNLGAAYESFHPNQKGQEAYARLIAPYIN